ncbi:phosphatase PAP2 family protein [Patescibacteria group bacterium]|nr:phosphatase PAP2 family protein [Patescibacteria group bacterium]
MFSLDIKIFDLIHQLVGKSRLLDLTAIFFADYVGYLLIIVVLFLIFSNPPLKDEYGTSKELKTRIYNSAFILLSALLSLGIFTKTIKFFYDKPRPFVALEFQPLMNQAVESAFPSGHMAFYFALVFALYFLGYKRWFVFFSVVLLLMGVARVFIGVHWPIDIISGIGVAFLSVYIVKLVLSLKR